MAKYANKVLSVILCLSMLLPMTPAVYAADDAAAKVSERSYFDFEATEYQVNENDGELKIKIVRHGEGNDEADVAFKAADLLSSYGDDYEILDENGNSLPKVYGKSRLRRILNMSAATTRPTRFQKFRKTALRT